MKDEDGLDEAGDPGGRAPQFAEEPQGLEGGDGLLEVGPDLCVGPVHRLLASGEGLPPSPARDADRVAGAPVAGRGLPERNSRGQASGCVRSIAPCGR